METLFPGYAANEEFINELLNQLDNYTCEKGVGEQCSAEDGYQGIIGTLEEVLPSGKALVDFRNQWRPYLGGGGVDGSVDGSTGSGVPAEVGDRIEDLSPVLGPSIRLGRRAWIDP